MTKTVKNGIVKKIAAWLKTQSGRYVGVLDFEQAVIGIQQEIKTIGFCETREICKRYIESRGFGIDLSQTFEGE